MANDAGKLALLWRGDREARRQATPDNNRWQKVFAALAELGIAAEPAVYDEDTIEEVREQLLQVDGVLVWVNPVLDGQRNRESPLATVRCVRRRSGARSSIHIARDRGTDGRSRTTV